MSRSMAREFALQALFHLEFNEADTQSILETIKEENKSLSSGAMMYAQQLVDGVSAQKEAIDAELSIYAQDWKVARMPAVDRNILRIAVYEMKHQEEQIDDGVAINEAVELAKRFGTDRSPKFINGVLGKLSRAAKD
ncbi:MAG: transcription antitermination factor NusB [Selenomonadales bacterium]|nr:transcription antitermination factor NusB [Selenomonadales bacterium]MBQ6713289.1 transcription antitermination factor NusB [Selenomonadales bacterium]